MTVRITTTPDSIRVHAPYDRDFPTAARALHGRWDASQKEWIFDPRDGRAVRDLCVHHYGTTGDDTGDTVTVHLDLDQADLDPVGDRVPNGIRWSGRVLATRDGRDQPAKLGDGVRIVTGGFPASGGSVRYPQLDREGPMVLEVRDVPRARLAELSDMNGVTVISDAVDAAALRAERVRLADRIAEIDALLTLVKD